MNPGQDAEEGRDALVDVGEVEQHPLDAVGEGNKQGDVEQHAEQHVALGLFHVVVDAHGQSPAGPGGRDHGVEAVGLPVGLGLGVKGPAPGFEVANALADDAVVFEVFHPGRNQLPHVPGPEQFGDGQDGPGVDLVADADGIFGAGV